MKKNNKLLILLLLTLIIIGCQTEDINIFVNPMGNDNNVGNTKELPLQTIEKAIEESKKIRGSNSLPIIINLSEGEYRLSSPILITAELNNISIIGKSSDKVIIKGSKILNTNWKKKDKNIWVADVSKGISFDQLFINSEKQILARYPNYDKNGGDWNGSAEDAISKERVSTWKNPVGGFVHTMHSGRWGDFHYQITGIDNNGELTLIGGHQNNRPSSMHKSSRMVENIFEELDSEKEWYFDKKNHKLYLWNPKNTDLNKATIEVSTLKHLIELKGTKENLVKNITIKNIRFEHTRRTFMEKYHQLLRSDWTIYRGGAILLDATEYCTIIDCVFKNLGGNVIFLNAYNKYANISGNHIYNCGASAISFVGDSTAVRSPSFQYGEFIPLEEIDTIPGPANDLYPSTCKVENNLINDIGKTEKQVAGIQISMAMKIHVKNNSIYNVPRAGINVSEGTWGGHIIEFNDVFNTVLESGDHGSFNSWGRDRFWHPNRVYMDSINLINPKMPLWDAIHTTIIRNNRFRCDHGWDIDLDDGSSNYHIYNNLCLNGGLKLREGFYRIVENNIMINNGFHPHVWFANSNDIFRRNIMMTKHFDIRLKSWGKEVDYNLFPNADALYLAQKNNTDVHSLYENPEFLDPKKGNYTVSDSSLAITKLGFKNFSMDKFGVQKPSLNLIAQQPNIPELDMLSFYKEKTVTQNWLGGVIKNIESIGEQSALGLHTMDGVKILKLSNNSQLKKSGILVNDVIIKIEGKKVKNISALTSLYKQNIWHESVKFTVFRNQQEMEFSIKQ